MVCLSGTRTPISPEAQALIARNPFHQAALRELAALLPQDDKELDHWIASARKGVDPSSFHFLLCAGAIVGRRMQASHLTPMLWAQLSPLVMAWIIWHMEGNVTKELLRVLAEETFMTNEGRALALFVAAAWWQEYRKDEELPQQILRLATKLSEQKKLDLRALIHLRQLGILIGGSFLASLFARAAKPLTRRQKGRELERIFGLLNGPFERFVYARETHNYGSRLPQRRAVEHIGRNALCKCGSGKKYKHCCEAQDRLRLSRSSSVPGVTGEELVSDIDGPLTDARMDAMGPAAVAALDPDRVPKELERKFLAVLVLSKQYEKAIAALRKFGVNEETRAVWNEMFGFASESWRPDIARQLMELFPDAEEKLGEKPHAGIRFLLVGDEPALAMQELQSSVEALLKLGDLEELQRLTWTLLESPYRGIGILLARSFIPIVEEQYVPGLFDGILDARAKLNLSPEDEFTDWMDKRTLRKAREHETAAMQEQQDRLAAKMEEVRALKEEKARYQRELALRDRQERREREEAETSITPDEQIARERAELKGKIERLSALARQHGEEKLALRRALEKSSRDIEALKAAAHCASPGEEDADEDFAVEGNQPVRLLQFPEDFAKTLASYPIHVGRAAMNRLGRLASGEPAAFDHVKQLKTYRGVLRARIADKYRLLFCLEAGSIRVVDLIRRADLDRRIERLQTSGLPGVR